MGKTSQRFKVFKKIFSELKLAKEKEVTKDDMVCYREQVEKNLDAFINCELHSINGIEILKSLKEVNWNLLHNMYFASVENRDEILVNRSKKARESSTVGVFTSPAVPVSLQTTRTESSGGMPDLSAILNTPMFSQMMNSVLPVVQKAFEGKDLQNMNMNELVQGIMTRDPEKCGGVDINALMEESITKLKENNGNNQ